MFDPNVPTLSTTPSSGTIPVSGGAAGGLTPEQRMQMLRMLILRKAMDYMNTRPEMFQPGANPAGQTQPEMAGQILGRPANEVMRGNINPQAMVAGWQANQPQTVPQTAPAASPQSGGGYTSSDVFRARQPLNRPISNMEATIPAIARMTQMTQSPQYVSPTTGVSAPPTPPRATAPTVSIATPSPSPQVVSSPVKAAVTPVKTGEGGKTVTTAKGLAWAPGRNFARR